MVRSARRKDVGGIGFMPCLIIQRGTVTQSMAYFDSQRPCRRGQKSYYAYFKRFERDPDGYPGRSLADHRRSMKARSIIEAEKLAISLAELHNRSGRRTFWEYFTTTPIKE